MLGGPAVFGEEDGLKKRYPFADMFAFGYGEKVFANLRRYIESGAASVFEQPDFKTLESPYLTGEIELGGSIDTVRAETRRGCPFRCTFCKHRDTYSGKVHSFSNYERHLEELKLFKRSGIKKLNVLDPFFDDMQGHGESYLKWIRKVGFEGKVSLQIRPETLTTSFTEEASMNPNIIFEIGVQSLDPNVLKAIRRGGARTKEQLRQKLALCKTLGVATEVTMIYGLPFQTYDYFARDIGIIRNCGVTKISAFPLQVYPGTELGDHVREYGLTLRENPFGIAEVAETPSRDFAKMQTLAQCV